MCCTRFPTLWNGGNIICVQLEIWKFSAQSKKWKKSFPNFLACDWFKIHLFYPFLAQTWQDLKRMLTIYPSTPPKNLSHTCRTAMFSLWFSYLHNYKGSYHLPEDCFIHFLIDFEIVKCNTNNSVSHVQKLSTSWLAEFWCVNQTCLIHTRRWGSKDTKINPGQNLRNMREPERLQRYLVVSLNYFLFTIWKISPRGAKLLAC